MAALSSFPPAAPPISTSKNPTPDARPPSPLTPISPPPAPSPLLILLLEAHGSADPSTPDAFSALAAPYLSSPPPDPLPVFLPPLFDLMLTYPSHIPLQITITHLLTTTAASSSCAALALAEAKAIQLLIHTMLFHTTSLDISLHSLAALAAILPEAPHLVPPVLPLFAVEVVVAAAKTFLDDQRLQKLALHVLRFLAKADNPHDPAAELRRGGHMRAALRAVKQHRQDPQVALEASHLIGQVAKTSDRETMEQMARLGAIRILCVIIIACKDETQVQFPTFHALTTFVVGDGFCAAQLASMRGTEIVLRAMRKFRDSLDLRINCLAMLDTLAALDDMQAMAVFTLGGLEPVLSSMIEYRQNLKVQEYAISIVDRLVRLRDEVRVKLLADGGLKTISASLRTHIRNEPLLEKGVLLLRHIRYTK